MKQFLFSQLSMAGKSLREDPSYAYDLYRTVLEKAEQEKYFAYQGKALLGLSHACRNLGEIGLGFKHAKASLALYEELEESEGIARSRNFLGIFCYHSGMHEEAAEHFFIAEKLAEDHRLPPTLHLSILNNIAEVYHQAKDLVDSLLYYERAYSLAGSSKNLQYENAILSNMGKIHQATGNLKKADACFSTALSRMDDHSDPLIHSEAYLNMSRLLIDRDQLEEAQKFLDISDRVLGDLRETHLGIDNLLTRYRLSAMTSPACLTPLNKALQLAEHHHSHRKLMEIHHLLSQHYEESEDHRLALHHYKQHHQAEVDLNAQNLRFKMEILLSQKRSFVSNDHMEQFRNILPVDTSPEALKRQAHYDELTALPNRYLIRMMFGYLKKKASDHCWIAILDLDHFKWVNDGMGHLFGDECLVRLANLISRTLLPHQGFAGRYGGEEFLIILTDSDYATGLDLFRSLIERIRQLDIDYHYGQADHRLTASIGATYIEETPTVWETALEAADKALYRAKAAGRNRLVIAND